MSYFITNKEKFRPVVIGSAAIGALIVGSRLNYPPSINMAGWGFLIDIVRFLLWLATGSLIYMWSRRWGLTAGSLIAGSGAVWSMVLGYPLEAVMFLLFMGSGLVKSNRLRYGWWIGLLIIAAIINFNQAAIWQSFNRIKIGAEVDRRITAEDVLSEKVELPLWLRRTATNKVTVGMANLWKEGAAVADLETLFFGDMNPLSRKMMPLFFWPGVVMFLIGLVGAKKELLWLIPGVMYFWLTGGEYYLRFLWLVPGVAIIMQRGLMGVFRFGRWWGLVLTGLYLFGVVGFARDLIIRPDYWLDNRPLVYQSIYEFIGQHTSGPTRVTDLIGDSQKYCIYFLKGKCEGMEFGISQDKKFSGIQAGFIGEFLGKDINNKFIDSWEDRLEEIGFRLLYKKNIRDSVAWGYGDWIVVVESK